MSSIGPFWLKQINFNVFPMRPDWSWSFFFFLFGPSLPIRLPLLFNSDARFCSQLKLLHQLIKWHYGVATSSSRCLPCLTFLFLSLLLLFLLECLWERRERKLKFVLSPAGYERLPNQSSIPTSECETPPRRELFTLEATSSSTLLQSGEMFAPLI